MKIIVLTIISIIAIQLVFGRKVSFPYGIISGLSPLTVGLIAILCDMALTLFVRMVINKSMKLKFFRRFWKRITLKQEKTVNSCSFKWLFNLGKSGVVVSLALPFTGGVWTGCALAKILNLKDGVTILLIALGSILGSLLFILSSMGVISLLG